MRERHLRDRACGPPQTPALPPGFPMLPRPSAPAPLQGGYSGDREPLRNALWTDVSFAGLRKRTAPLSDDGGAPRLGRRLRAGAVPSCPHRRAVTPCYGPAVTLWIG